MRSWARARCCPRPTVSTSDACCRSACITPRRAWASGGPTASARRSSCRAAISAMRSPACGRARRACRSARWCWRTTPTAPCRTIWRAAHGSRGRASPRWPRPWTSAIRATWSACARCFRASRSCAPWSVPARSRMRRSVRASAPAIGNSARSGARTPRPRRRPGSGCRSGRASGAAGCWCRPPTRPSSARSSNRSSSGRCRCRKRSRNSSRVPRSVLKSTPT